MKPKPEIPWRTRTRAKKESDKLSRYPEHERAKDKADAEHAKNGAYASLASGFLLYSSKGLTIIVLSLLTVGVIMFVLSRNFNPDFRKDLK